MQSDRRSEPDNWLIAAAVVVILWVFIGGVIDWVAGSIRSSPAAKEGR